MSQLATVPSHRQHTIVVGTAVRKSLPVLQAYLASLAWQELPPNVHLHPIFVTDYPEPNGEAERYLKAWVKERGGEVLAGGPTAKGDFSDDHPVTHQWSPPAMQRVGKLKNRILRRAVDLKVDAVWLADADLIMDRTTFWSLYHAEQRIACAVYWTHWQKTPTPDLVVHAGPQVWLRHPYVLSGRGMEEAEFRALLIQRQLVQVWGQGACTLIHRSVLEAGIDFSWLPDVAPNGMMAGEDRHFCLKAERSHIPMYADGWPDIQHIYHQPEDVARIPEVQTRLGVPHPQQASLGDLVSLVISAVEPIPNPDGSMVRLPSQHIRGRLGALQMMPEVEEAIYHTARGQTRIVPVHFPASHPIGQYRGSRRLIKVHVIDVKPYGFAPVVEQELFVGPKSGAWADMTGLTRQQMEGIKEVALA